MSSRDGAIFSRRKFLARFRIFLDLEPQGPQVEVVVVLWPPGAVREAVAAQRRVPTFPVFGQTWKLNEVTHEWPIRSLVYAHPDSIFV